MVDDDPRPRALRSFAVASGLFLASLWYTQYIRSPSLGAAVLAVAVVGGAAVVRPGWNIRPTSTLAGSLLWITLLAASGAAAAAVLITARVPLPYDVPRINVWAALPGMAALVSAEELLFRQVMFRWLESRYVRPRVVIWLTGAVFGMAHLGPAFVSESPLRLFTCLQTLYLTLVGGLLGELRRSSGSWAVSSVGHVAHNVSVLGTLVWMSHGAQSQPIQ